MTRRKTRKYSILLIQTALLFACLGSLGSGAQLSSAAVQPSRPGGEAFLVPVRVETYGNAWNGYLAFGLWQYNSTDLSGPLHSYLVVMTTGGQLLYLRQTNNMSYWPVKYTSENTLMFEGEPDTLATHFWNLNTNKTVDLPNVWGHHDIEFNPVTGTFLTLRDYVRVIDGKKVLMDKIVELNDKGDILWTWDTYAEGHFGLAQACPCNDTTAGYLPGETMIDLTHSNSLQWNYQENIIYVNMRHLNTFCKINKTTGKTIWCLGEHGDFTLLNRSGERVSSLWYHAHAVRQISPNVFLMFDNDYHNTTKPCPAGFEGTNANSRMLEITVNEQDMTAWTSWSWTAAREYWTPYFGKVDVLPNGDRIATFGSQSHYLPNSGGAAFVEVNREGQVVRTYVFPYGWAVYRIEEIGLQTINDYDGTWRMENFGINLKATNGIAGVRSTQYVINNGPVKTVDSDGQPQIATEGSNNTLEYWSVDSNGIEESPHKMLTGIKLDRTPPTISITSPLNDSQMRSSTAVVTWAGSDDVSGIGSYEVRLDGKSWTRVGTDTTYTFNGLWDGGHTVEVRGFDAAGNQSTRSVGFTVSTGRTEYVIALSVVVVAVALGGAMLRLRAKKHR
jgi:hypothetical protein